MPFPPELGTFCPRVDATELCRDHLIQLTRLRQLPSHPALSAFCLLTGSPSSTERSKGSLLYGCRRTSGGTLDLGDGNFSLPQNQSGEKMVKILPCTKLFPEEGAVTRTGKPEGPLTSGCTLGRFGSSSGLLRRSQAPTEEKKCNRNSDVPATRPASWLGSHSTQAA